MNARSSPSATMAAIMAFNTNAAGPSLQSLSKMDPIAQSKTQITAVLRALLIARICGYLVARSDLESPAAAVSLRGETPDLIHDSKVFRTGSEEDISENVFIAPVREWKVEACESRRPPRCP